MGKLKLFLAAQWKRLVALALVFALIGCSVTVLAKTFTDPQTYSKTIQSIDEKKVTVLGVSAAIAGSATLLAAIPDDATTPLAEELMDLSSYLVAVVCVLVLEKSLLTVFGAVACYVLFPVAGIFAFAFILKRKQFFVTWAIKLAVLALAFLLIVPSAMKLSDYIYEVNQIAIEQEVDEIVEPNEDEEDLPWYKKLWNTVTEAVQSTVEEAVDGGKKALNKFIDAVSVFVIAYCAVPIFVVFLFLWLFKFLFGLNINVSVDNLTPNALKEKRKRKENPALNE